MSEDSNIGPRGQSFGEGEGPKLLGQLLADGAEIVGSDGKKIGDLKEVRDADFLVDRTLKRDLYIPVTRVGEVSEDGKIVLDISSNEVSKEDWRKPSARTDPAASFSANPDDIKRGPWEITKND